MSSASRARVWLVFSPHLSFRLWGPAAEHSSGGGGGGRGRVLAISGKLLGLEPMAFTAWICTLKIMGESEKEIEFICWILHCNNMFIIILLFIILYWLDFCGNASRDESQTSQHLNFTWACVHWFKITSQSTWPWKCCTMQPWMLSMYLQTYLSNAGH